MKMIVAILANETTEQVSNALLQAGYRVTKFASTAGFLSGGTTTLMVGVQDEQLEDALGIIREYFSPLTKEDEVRASIYVIGVNNFERIP